MNEKDGTALRLSHATDLRQEAEQRLRSKKAAPVEGMAEVDVRALLHELQVHQIELEMQNEELLRAQTAVQEISDKYHDLFDFAPIGYFRLDGQGRILEVNLAGAAILGIDRSTAVKQRFGQYVTAQSRARFAALLRGVLQADGRRACEIELQRSEELLYAVVEGVPAHDGGANGSLRVIVSDISERKRAEERLRESEQQFRTLADSIPNLAWWANSDGFVTWYNRRWYEYTGTTPEQMEGWGWQSVHDPDDLPRVLQRWKASIASGEPFYMEFPLRRCFNSKDMVREMIQCFFDEVDNLFPQMRAALEKGDLMEVGRLGHHHFRRPYKHEAQASVPAYVETHSLARRACIHGETSKSNAVRLDGHHRGPDRCHRKGL